MILIVDDDASWLRQLGRIVGRFADTTSVRDEPSALTAIEGTPDLAGAIVDLRLGAADGLDVLDRLRQQRPTAAAMVLTGYLSDDVVARAAVLRATPLAKPPDLAALEAWTQDAVAARANGRTTVSALLSQLAGACGWTPRELQVVLAAERGLSPYATAVELGATDIAVKKARSGAIRKARQTTMEAVIDRVRRAALYNEPLLPASFEAALRQREQVERRARRAALRSV